MASINNQSRREYINNRNIRPNNRYAPYINYKTSIKPSTLQFQGDIPPIKENSIISNSISNNQQSASKNQSQKEVKTSQHSTKQNNFSGVNPLSSIMGIFKEKNISLSLDRDKLILIFLIYLLYKEDKQKDNVRLLIALAYILL